VLWYDDTYGYYYSVNSSGADNGVGVFLKPQAPLQNLSNSSCSFTFMAATIPTLAAGTFVGAVPNPNNITCCIPTAMNLTRGSNAYSFYVGYTLNLSNPYCADIPISQPISPLILSTLPNGTQIWEDLNMPFSFTSSGNNDGLIGTFDNSCTFEINPNGELYNITLGTWSRGELNAYSSCCIPESVTITSTGGFSVDISYNFDASVLNSPNCGNISSSSTTFSSSLTQGYNSELSLTVWNDANYPFQFTYYMPSLSLLGFYGSAPNSCSFGMVNYTELSPQTYLDIVVNNFGTASNMMWFANPGYILYPGCCIPDAVNITLAPNSYNLSVSYFFGPLPLGSIGNSWCQNVNQTAQIVTSTLQITPYQSSFNTTMWYDPWYGYYYVIDPSTSNESIVVQLEPSPPAKPVWGVCWFAYGPAQTSTVAGNFTTDASNSNGIATCCTPNTVNIQEIPGNLYEYTIYYTFDSPQNNSYCQSFKSITGNPTSTLVLTTFINGSQVWQDNILPFQFTMTSKTSGMGYFNSECSFSFSNNNGNSVPRLASSFIFVVIVNILHVFY
jgi:hypothetical protein